MKTKGRIYSVVRFLILFLIVAIVLLPVIYTVTNSFMGADEIADYYGGQSETAQFHLFPDDMSLSGYYQILLRQPDYLVKFWNSLGYTLLIVGVQVLVALFASYAFARYRFPLRNVLFTLVILLMMMPYQVTLVANYMILDKLNLIGGWSAVILPAVFMPLGVFILRQSMSGVPKELIEAARLDGAGDMRILFSIVAPRCKGGIAAVLILSFVDNWNMVEQPLMFLSERRQYPLSIFLAQANSQIPEIGFACGVLAMLPVIILFLFFEDALVEGITATTK